ncbi:sodium:calcium antiporter [Halomicroarcula sp. GCM10025709]|uniref:sodium:calcium antiporter n=1 Tax=Haloarcula TaxID=2237 RepID=UPI0024C3AA72|nr:hypothetical protein [Halomicroarcula sp. YJ-61-S]
MVVSDPTTLVELGVGAVALAVLVRSAGVAVDRALALARHYDLPELLIGMFVVSIGTSLPEISAHLVASLGILSGTLDPVVASATVLGSNMGSSTVQQLLLFGLFLVGYGHYTPGPEFLRTSYVPMVAAFVLVLGLGADGAVSRLDGAVLLLAFGGYTYYSFTRTVRTTALPESPPESIAVGRDLAVTALALAGVLGSAFVVLAVVEATVTRLQLGGSMLGVLTLGIAAALPELSTVVESIRRRTPSLALGTLVGSNVVNSLVGIGLGGLLSTYTVPQSVLLWDLPFKLLAGVGLLGYLWFVGDGSLGRREGATLVVLYLVYLTGRLLVFPV